MSNLQFYIPQSLSAIQKGPKFEQDKYSILNCFFISILKHTNGITHHVEMRRLVKFKSENLLYLVFSSVQFKTEDTY